MSHRSRLTLTALTLVAAGAFAPQAQASGFQLREQSPSAQGNAFAGVSAGGNDISSMFFNPAVMTQFSGNQFVIGGSYVGLKAAMILPVRLQKSPMMPPSSIWPMSLICSPKCRPACRSP